MAGSHEAYVDTSALIAFANKDDEHHGTFDKLFDSPPRLVTTSLVIAEAHVWFLRNSDPAHALDLLGLFDDVRPLVITSVGTEELQGGMRMLRRFSDQAVTLTDAVGLHIMQLRKIKVCWSTDFHMSLTGARLAIH